MKHNRGPWGIPVDDPALDGREMGCRKCGGECVVRCPECVNGYYIHENVEYECGHCDGTGEVPCECQEG